MKASDRRAKAEAAGYTVWPSQWEDSAGDTGISRPNGDNLDDYEGSEAAGWRAAYQDLRRTETVPA